MEPAEPVMIQVPSTSKTNAAGEEVITLEIEPGLLQPENETTPVPVGKKSTGRRGVKRTYESSNTAPDYAATGDTSVSDEQIFPAYLFQNVPSKLQTDNLRKLALVSIIEHNKAATNFYDLCKGCIGPLKNALLAMAGQQLADTISTDDHAYHVRGELSGTSK